MFDLRQHAIGFESTTQPSSRDVQPTALIADLALTLYRREQWWAKVGRVWGMLTRRSPHLFTLAEVQASGVVRGRRFGGPQEVALRQIRGSESRTHDFDHAFRPLQTHTKHRWLSIAMAHYTNTPLPPVTLTQVGNVYFVQDGHHRVSVARTMGHGYIDAVVTIWDVVGTMPWEQAQPASTYQPA